MSTPQKLPASGMKDQYIAAKERWARKMADKARPLARSVESVHFSGSLMRLRSAQPLTRTAANPELVKTHRFRLRGVDIWLLVS